MINSKKVGAVILSAGESKRMLQPKSFLIYNKHFRFIDKIIEKYDDVSVWKSISSNQQLTEKYIDKYIDKFDWNELSENHNFSFCRIQSCSCLPDL